MALTLLFFALGGAISGAAPAVPDADVRRGRPGRVDQGSGRGRCCPASCSSSTCSSIASCGASRDDDGADRRARSCWRSSCRGTRRSTCAHGWSHISSFFVGENRRRYSDGVGVNADHRGPFFYLPVLFSDAFPWSFLLVRGRGDVVRRPRLASRRRTASPDGDRGSARCCGSGSSPSSASFRSRPPSRTSTSFRSCRRSRRSAGVAIARVVAYRRRPRDRPACGPPLAPSAWCWSLPAPDSLRLSGTCAASTRSTASATIGVWRSRRVAVTSGSPRAIASHRRCWSPARRADGRELGLRAPGATRASRTTSRSRRSRASCSRWHSPTTSSCTYSVALPSLVYYLRRHIDVTYDREAGTRDLASSRHACICYPVERRLRAQLGRDRRCRPASIDRRPTFDVKLGAVL